MPQIWLSYDEIAGYLGCGNEEAAARSASARWPRRLCHDGLTRAKLPAADAEAFVRGYYLTDRKVSESADERRYYQGFPAEADGHNRVAGSRMRVRG